MLTDVYRTIGSLDRTEDGDDEAQVIRKLNEGVTDVLLNTRCYILPATMDETSAEGDYTLDARILHIEYLSIGTQRMEVARPQDILQWRDQGASVGTTTYYTVQGADLFQVYPTPSAGDTITAYYVPAPSPMTSVDHDPSDATYGGIPSEFHRAIVLYALSQMADEDDDQSSGQGVRYQQDYERALTRIRKHVSQKGGTSLAPFRMRRRRFAFHDNSTDGGW